LFETLLSNTGRGKLSSNKLNFSPNFQKTLTALDAKVLTIHVNKKYGMALLPLWKSMKSSCMWNHIRLYKLTGKKSIHQVILHANAFQTFLCYGTLIHSEFGCGTHTLKQIA